MAWADSDNGRSAASATPERLGSRVNIITPNSYKRRSLLVDQLLAHASNVGLEK